MVGSCGTCLCKMFGNVQGDIGYMLRKAVWTGDSHIMSFYWGDAEIMDMDDIIQDKLVEYSEKKAKR